MRKFSVLFLAVISTLWSATSLGDHSLELKEADQLLQDGHYQRALHLYRQLLESATPQPPSARSGLLSVLLLTGQYKALEQQALEFLKDEPEPCQLNLLLGEAYSRRGELLLARRSWEEARQIEPCRNPADLRLAKLFHDQGRFSESRRLASVLHARIIEQGEEDLGLAAVALRSLQRYREANELFRRAIRANPRDLETQIEWGNLFLEKYDPANASSSFSAALKINPNYPEALLGLALTKTGGQGQQAQALLDKALEINPNLEAARVALAEVAIEREDFRAAEEELGQCLEINPRSLRAQALRAVLHYARHDESALEGAVKSLLDLNPRYGEVYQRLARFCVTQRLYQEAVAFFRQAIQLNPNLFSAYADLGVNLWRIGEAAAAKEILEKAYQVDPFNLWTVNTLRLMDRFVEFEERTTSHFTIKLHREEAGLLGHYVPQLLEQAYATLSSKYGFRPAKPVYFEMYPEHEDFAVRALGVPGLGALGVCFGPGIVMDSPRARPRGRFNWGSTLWHEFAHVITLKMTDHRVPRWFSEGISVMEERQAMAGWGDRLDVEILKLIQQGKLLPIAELNGGFLRPQFPGQVALSYFQAGKACEFIESRFGFSKLLAMLQGFKKNESLEQTLRKVLGLSPQGFDGEFWDYLKGIIGKALDNVDFEVLQHKELMDTPEQLQALLEEAPDNFFANLRMASYHRERGEEEAAIRLLKRAKTVFPDYAEPDSPYRQLSEIYQRRDMAAAVIQELQQLTEVNGSDFESLTSLAAWLRKAGRSEEAQGVLERAIYVYPFDPDTHKQLAALLMEQHELRLATREYRALLALKPADPATAHLNLARALIGLGQRAEAKAEVFSALEIAPTFEPAQELLLSLVE